MLDSIENKNTYLKISMLSPERILELSNGEVVTSETINYRNKQPSSIGLFSEKTFGPVKDWECSCGKYKKESYKGIVCDNCGVLVTTSRVRRERFGHIELGCNIVLPQYLYGGPSILATLLDIPQNYLERIVFENLYIDTSVYWAQNNRLTAIEDNTSKDNGSCGVDGILAVLKTIDIKKELEKLDEQINENTGYLALAFKHRKEVLEQFEFSGDKPEWMITSRLLVMPAGLRPIFEYNGKLYASELNDRYRLVIQRAHLLKQLKERMCPRMVIQSQRRMIQLAVDALFDSKLEKEEYTKIVSESLLNSIQKKVDHNVDFSASGMVVPDPSIDFGKMGMPFEVATVLFKPFIANKLVESGINHNVKAAFREVDNNTKTAIEALLQIADTFVVVASTYNGRLISFKVKLIDGEFFKIHSSVYEMLELGKSDTSMHIKVFAQLSNESAEEALSKIGVKSQIVSNYSEKLQLLPNRYARKWVSEMSRALESREKYFIGKGEVYCAYANGSINIHELVDIRCQTHNGFEYHEKTSLGRLIINEFMPQNMGIVNRSGLKNKYLLEYNYEIDESQVIQLCEEVYHRFGAKEYLAFLKKMYSVIAQYSIDIEDDKGIEVKEPIRNNDIKRYDDQITLMKKKLWNLKLAKSKGDSLRINIDYQSEAFQEYIYAFLKNRRVAGNIYSFADTIASDGEVITEKLLSEFRMHRINTVSIYFDSINECGEYSEFAYGEKVEYNPFIVALLAVRDAMMKMSDSSIKTLLEILLAKDGFLCSEQIEILLQEKDGDIGRLLEIVEDKESRTLSFQKLNIQELVLTKTYLVYSVLKQYNISVSVRLLCLLVEVLSMDKDNDNREGTPCFDMDTELSSLGEYAIKNHSIDLNCIYFRDVYGKIDVYANSRLKKESDRGNQDYEEYYDDSFEEMFDYIDEDIEEYSDYDDSFEEMYDDIDEEDY